MTLPLLVSLRPHHWVKNLVVFAAPLFALRLDLPTFWTVSLAFAAFSMASSGFYLINDIVDLEADRLHPVKRHRPMATGRLSVPVAAVAAALLLAASVAVAFIPASSLGLLVLAYLLLQAGYNLLLKHVAILDILTIAAGFVLRALGGAVAAGVPASSWFILCIGFLALFLGIEKRKSELVSVGDEGSTRAVLRAYSLSHLLRMEHVATAGALLTYALWTVEGARTSWMLATIPPVAYAIFKYQQLAERGLGEEPEKTLLRSPSILSAVLLWAVLCLTLLMLFGGP